MKRMMMAILFAVVTMTALLPWAQAAVPGLIHHQGYLADADGTPVTDDVEIVFSLYDQETEGSVVWTEGPMTVPVTDGLFQVLLGQSAPFTPALFSGPRWLEVIVDGEYLEPRERIVSTLLAISAGDAETVAGIEPADLEESGEIDADIATHTAEASAHHAKTTSFADLVDTASDAQIPDDITVTYATAAGDADTAAYATGAGDADTLDGQDASAFAATGHSHGDSYYTKAEVDAIVSGLQTTIDQLTTLLAGVTRAGSDITFSGVNVHIVNGTGTTDGAVNGLGNLVVGYNELRGFADDRTGSHNMVVGMGLNYSSYGGLVVGLDNTISGAYSSVSGGRYNEASGDYSSVAGGGSDDFGKGNVAFADYSAILGGINNLAGDPALTDHDIGKQSTVSGGSYHTASGICSSVSGGFANKASHIYASVSGGQSNTASQYCASVSGGWSNTASEDHSSISGGRQNLASGQGSSVNGGWGNEASEDYSSVSGGQYNQANGMWSSVSGGGFNTASGDYSSVAGGGGESSGYGNVAFADYSAILGGRENIAGDPALTDHDIGTQSTVSGGYLNEASGSSSSVSGGYLNEASGSSSSVSGGHYNTASLDFHGSPPT